MQLQMNLSKSRAANHIEQISLRIIGDRALGAGLLGVRKLSCLPAMQKRQKAINRLGLIFAASSQSPGVECLVLQNGLSNREAAAEFKDTKTFTQRRLLVRNVGKNRSGCHDIDRRIGDPFDVVGRAMM